MTVGELKANFSEVINMILAGKEVSFSYGKKKNPIGKVVPFKKNKSGNKIKLGLLEGKVKVKFSKNWKMTDEELLAS